MYARLDESDVRCGKCGVQLGRLVVGQDTLPVMERGGPVLGQIVVKQRVELVPGYLPNGDIFAMTASAAKRLVHARQRGEALEPGWAHGDTWNGIVEFPARVLCYRCGELVTFDRPGFP